MPNRPFAISNNGTTTVANIVNQSTKRVVTQNPRKWVPLLQGIKMDHATTDAHVPDINTPPVNSYWNTTEITQIDARGNAVANNSPGTNHVTRLIGKQKELLFHSYTATGTYMLELGSQRNTPIAIQFSCIVGSGAGTLSVQRSISVDGINFTKTNISAVTVAAGSTEVITLVDMPEGLCHCFEVTVSGTTEYYAVMKG